MAREGVSEWEKEQERYSEWESQFMCRYFSFFWAFLLRTKVEKWKILKSPHKIKIFDIKTFDLLYLSGSESMRIGSDEPYRHTYKQENEK